MKHFASSAFWSQYNALPPDIREKADKAYDLLKLDAAHPSLHFKKVGRFWSARIDLRYRALATNMEDGLLWFWIGDHADYERLIG